MKRRTAARACPVPCHALEGKLLFRNVISDEKTTKGRLRKATPLFFTSPPSRNNPAASRVICRRSKINVCLEASKTISKRSISCRGLLGNLKEWASAGRSHALVL
ncbi:hypothetical protein EVAR_93811_1 [Eumeta japonica]|uniref:Uncharacterized protein n=1 Tax=Eumeta variegata TaxID=151549 RepID=A0A4C1VAI0_EUMVA|nr:hypothetical protein EVAR_93811_1 [Eumeta japonica]